MKTALVTPILQNGDADKPHKYRPIMVLSAASKILEKILNSRLVSYLEKNDIRYKHQYGFQKIVILLPLHPLHETICIYAHDRKFNVIDLNIRHLYE